MQTQQYHRNSYRHDALMRYARRLGFGDIHEKIDRETGLHAIIAIHNTTLGPAIGGTRFFPYTNSGTALKDVLRLSYNMTLKAAISDLPHGGAKAVIIMPPTINDRQALFRAYGDFVHTLNGRYITACDVNTSIDDMTTISERTPFVIGARGKTETDVSPATTKGVLRSMEAAVKFQYDQDHIDGIRVAIQGVGAVGFDLAKQLTERGAIVTVSDINPESIERCRSELGANIVSTQAIYDVPCDIFAPCAMGGSLSSDTIKRLQCDIVVGSANNQLAHINVAQQLKSMNILYAPDYLVNSGGLINAAMVYDYNDSSIADQQIDKLYHTVLALLERAKTEDKTTTEIAETMVKEKLSNPPSIQPKSIQTKAFETVSTQ